jgi:hypothetical protein
LHLRHARVRSSPTPWLLARDRLRWPRSLAPRLLARAGRAAVLVRWLTPAPRWSRSRRRAGSLATLASAAGPRAGRAHMRSLAGAAAARPHSLALAAPLCKCRVKSDVCVAASANAGRDFLRPLRSAARLAPAPLGRACLRPLQSATQLAPALLGRTAASACAGRARSRRTC